MYWNEATLGQKASQSARDDIQPSVISNPIQSTTTFVLDFRAEMPRTFKNKLPNK